MFKAYRLPYWSLGITVLWLFSLLISNEIPPDTGDGIMHFFISEAAWEDPLLLLDHWGKPLFILLSSPFAQFGFNGIIIFQLLVYCLSCILSFAILKKLNTSIFLVSILPFILV